MKKKIYTVLLLISFILLVGCNGLTSLEVTSTTNELQIIQQVLDQYDFQYSNGFDFTSTQYLGEQIVNSDSIEQRIDWDKTNIYTEYTSMRTSEFNTDTINKDSQVVYFYSNNKMGSYVDETLTWESISLNEYMAFSLPDINISELNTSNGNITTANGKTTFESDLSGTDLESLLDATFNNISSVHIEIIIKIATQELLEITIAYEMDLTNTIIIFTPYYDAVQVIIPQ